MGLTKFQRGDRVRVKHGEGMNSFGLYAGQLYTVSDTNGRRVRGTGPPPEPMENRSYYRPERIMAWLSGTRLWWEYRADWLAAHGVGVDEVDEAAVQDRIQVLERLGVFD